MSQKPKKPYRAPAVKTKPLVVTVGGAEYPAVMKDKVLGFKSNWAVRAAANDSDCDLNVLCAMYQIDNFPLRDYAEYHMMLGYSVSGFCDLSEFQHLEVVTPFWTRKGERPWETSC